jgi:hypothetical protein
MDTVISKSSSSSNSNRRVSCQLSCDRAEHRESPGFSFLEFDVVVSREVLVLSFEAR